MNAQFADNPAFLEYQDYLVQIQHAICRGDNQTADRLCDASENLGQFLSLAEVKWLQWLSSDLEMLCGEELLQPMKQTEDEYGRSMAQAWLDIEEYPEDLLELLRHNRGFLPQSRVAYARARAYEILGYKKLKIEFLRCAARLDADNLAYKLFLIDAATSQSDLSEILGWVENIFSSPVSTPVTILTAVGSVFVRTQFLSTPEARPVLGRLRHQVEHVLNQSKGHSLEVKVRVFGLLLLGGIFERLNRKSAATDCYRQAHSLDTRDDGPLIALGSILLDSKQNQAFSLFEQAATLNTRFPQPYLHLAVKELNAGGYNRSARLAEQILALEVPAKMHAYAHEILGLAELGANGVSDKAIRHLGEAVSLAPESSWMRENHEEALNMYNHRSESQGDQRMDLMLTGFDVRDIILEVDIQSKGFLSERLTSLSILSAKDESSRLARAA